MKEKAFDLLEEIINREKDKEATIIKFSREDALKKEDVRHLKLLDECQKEEFDKLSKINQKTGELLKKYSIVEADRELIEDIIEISEDYVKEVKPANEPESVDKHIELNKRLTEINDLFREYLSEDYEWLKVDEALSKYKTRQGTDREKEQTIEIPVSNNRRVYLNIFENGQKASLNTDPFKDPYKVKMDDAAYEFIGGKLTEDELPRPKGQGIKMHK
ncbi:hypothetical protein HYT26_02405 [Candidatus Pacearchaeota archaeon]|nr:hypothetical protein [Candidatus Pacearchaeota archaeon]